MNLGLHHLSTAAASNNLVMPRQSPDATLKYRITLASILLLTLHSITTTNNSIFVRRSLRATVPDIREARYLHETDSTLPPWAHFNLKSVHSRPDEVETPIFWHIPKVRLDAQVQVYSSLARCS
jgi:hypothetical protein